MLLQIPALFSAEEVREIRALLEGAEWVDGRVTAGHRAVSVKDNLQIPLDHPVARQLGERILERLSVTPLFLAAALPLRILPPRFNRYEGGGTYGNHVDNAVFPVPGTPVRVRTDVSTTIFFSDPDEYEGGELVVEDTFGEKHVKLPAGDAIVYPGSSLHRVTPVTSGTRFASFFWTQSLIRDDRQRRMLFELDSAIQQLTADHPDHPSIDGFTNTYHNLMRGWSET
ncbi:Fe(II)-dependent oxygenase [Erythrobacter sp. SG61-1L]|uniref:Fe2+-dependent dioxygenase n=1 Tax=Erythrobacter sp. SG61-1L TaxID=1603897 RepID=UPI0006C91F10|nr:Fe2+-dependent dioxygenase [Erythrobacter sp. SG61-1L]KPL66837.1 Fe(II)-dependent oxygenase [Erythrobacter sp. SG61-1L]